MSSPCSKCGTQMENSWGFCPKCGLAVTVHKPRAREPHLPHEKSSVPGAFAGLLFGVIIAPVLIILGTLLCLTGLGAFLGVPMIIAAILAPLAGPLLGLGERAVRCPWCNTREVTVADNTMHYCPNCDKEFAVDEDHHVPQAG